jgi:hypothetical protein
VGSMTNATIELIWLAHTLGRYVNRYRFDLGSTPVDFYEEAIKIDRSRNEQSVKVQPVGDTDGDPPS